MSRSDGFDWRGLKLMLGALAIAMTAGLWVVSGRGGTLSVAVCFLFVGVGFVGLLMHLLAFVRSNRG